MKTSHYLATIGLEIHAELRTKSKMFCSCKNDSDEKRPNTNICPICLGHPGTLPVLNKQAIRHVLAVGTALGGHIADYTEWDRKHYFYPDIPKGYQLSQYKYPLVTGGFLPASSSGVRVAITRVHLEEDTAKSTHDAHEKSLVDFNRSGVPLMELVTEPVIRDAETAGAFARELQLLLRTLGVAEANMEKGEMRVEANVSVASEENTKAGKFGVKTEVKNLNSFRSVERAIAHEIERQTSVLEEGGKVVQETRGWDEDKGETFSQRAKESSHDYRYFPDPDLPKLMISEISEFSQDVIEKGMPELPWDKRARFKKDFGMTDKEAAMLIESPALSAYFESTLSALASSKAAGSESIRLAKNYLLSDYLGLLKKDHNEGYERFIDSISTSHFAALLNLISAGALSSRGGKDLLLIMYKGDKRDPRAIATDKGLLQKSDEGALVAVVEDVIKAHQNVVSDYKAGKSSALQFLIGQGMKASKGSANPEVLRKLLVGKLG